MSYFCFVVVQMISCQCLQDVKTQCDVVTPSYDWTADTKPGNLLLHVPLYRIIGLIHVNLINKKGNISIK